jgi:hypothetical protein
LNANEYGFVIHFVVFSPITSMIRETRQQS